MAELSPAEIAAHAAFESATGDGKPSLDQIVATESYFQAACATGDVPPLTIDAEDWEHAPEDTTQRQFAVHKRLRRLGYAVPEQLPEGVTGDALWAVLRAAWTKFQADAFGPELPPELKPGELSAVDWDALQQLFNFETPLDVAHWFVEGAPRPALVRATRLRLQVAGFGVAPDDGDFQPVLDALRAFSQTVFDLGVTEKQLPPVLNADYAAVLFDYDGLSDALALSGPRLAALSGPTADRARNFLVCVAKVELWLHGLNSRPDGNTSFPMIVKNSPGPRGKSHTTSEPNPFFSEVATFLRENGRDVGLVTAKSLPALVPELLAISQPARSREDRISSGELVERLQGMLAKDDSLWTRIVQTGRRLVSSLFDGVKRAISWVGRLLRRGLDAVKQAVAKTTAIAVNLWRGVYHFMGGAAFHLRRALRAFGDGVEFLFTSTRFTDPTGHALFARCIDCDGSMVINVVADDQLVTALGRTLERGARCFSIACRILRLITSTVRTILATGGTGVLGFAPLILGLASAYQQVRELGNMLDALGA